VDSVFHEDGTDAVGPIALCEVQAYVYGALLGFADLADHAGDAARSEGARRRARALRERFEAAFWSEPLGTYVLALDGEKRPCRVRASNAGHCLLTGLADRERAHAVARSLTGATSFSGWGVRTLDEAAARYNPMSYHNGSVWPHDNALIALGMARYGFKEPVLRILTGLFDACLFLELRRVPELFCGFRRRSGQGPTLYPVACAPQSWAAASVYALLQATLGLTVSALERRVLFLHPTLPPFLESLSLRDLRVGDASVDLRLQRHGDTVAIHVGERRGNVEVVTIK
jgi:glycogen debranching enzyme